MGKPAPVSPFAPASLPAVPDVPGVAFATAEAGIRYKGRTDLLLAVFAPGTTVAGVLTRSKTRSAPVDWCAEGLRHGNARALVVNSGNANAFTGKKGREAVEITADAAADAVSCAPGEVFIASTGVIGEPLEAGKFAHLLKGLAASTRADTWPDAARAIMTTDTFPKLATRTVRIDGHEVVINGMCKGAGMIQPDMATMLCFVATDAPIAAPALQKLVSKSADETFNCVTVDSDTSTSDTLLVFATGEAEKRGCPRITDAADPRLADFAATLHDLLRELAILVAKDGEGITKFVTVEVEGAASDLAAKRIALSIANSPLVKTAIAGEDANWGRVVMAVGKSGEEADRDRLSISFGDIQVASEGERAPSYSEEEVSRYMQQPEITVRADIGIGTGRATVWTCDLTHGYIDINADYRS
ncbi:bifunctional glutamate N-acetyltransferase/amino-acid acetyltransferase ArgJ [Hyphomicrobium sp. D-2]|uniref:bifunctional glutamate N-acetyltransferase/amino-acid acetyltransferase ArgJ n=1 Tax=Hyphomicrobium sp. D-2 TaxID=3041621 RepID=UPI00245507CF|nr:bifunctional glutamate N-acetyltransferase/amino-acid acetyltransferase ArgJ [Hyphomicrobium sp. D-2]MDH4983522.1 bifunctional glutamate N-acetyltransferase/amino-acid acetyltransferase ArgJ [Hyphomicrobium sp. D-2]